MSHAARYAYLHARVSVLANRLLWHGRIDALIDAQAGSELTFQRVGLPRRPLEEDLDRFAIEQSLLDLLLADVAVLARPLTGAAHDLLVYWARRHELGNLKAIIRGRAAGRPPAWIREELLDVGPFATLPVEELLQTEDAAEMLRRLEATPYADLARRARAVFEQRHEVFALDAEVDKRYYAGLLKRVNALPVADQQQLRRLVGAIIDRNNLVWLLRYRFAYGLAPAHTYYLLNTGGAYLGGRQLRELVQYADADEVLRNLPAHLRAALGGAVSTAEVEDAMDREVERVAWTIIRRATFVVARAFAYLVERERQLRQVHVVLRGRQLGLGDRSIRIAAGLAGPTAAVVP